MFRLVMAVLSSLLLLASAASAEKGKLLMHFSADGAAPTAMPCYQGGDGPVTSAAVGVSGRLYILAADFNVTEGLKEVSFGIDFSPSIQLTNWMLLASLDVPTGTNWPESGDGIVVHWNPCTHQVNADPDSPDNGFAVLGYFQLTSTALGYVALTPNYWVDIPGGELYWRNCDLAYHFMTADRLGRFEVGGPGINPCNLDQPIPVVGSTWSRLKASY